jgi:hypothetical protein
LEHERHVAPRADDLRARDRHRPAAGGDEAGDDAKERRLAAAGAAEDRHELAVADLEIDLADRLDEARAGLEALRDPLDVDERVVYRPALRTLTATGDHMSAAFSGPDSRKPLRITLAVALNFWTSM